MVAHGLFSIAVCWVSLFSKSSDDNKTEILGAEVGEIQMYAALSEEAMRFFLIVTCLYSMTV